MIRKVRNCCETCENLVCVATTIGQLQHTEYLKPTFLDTFKWAIRPRFSQRQSHIILSVCCMGQLGGGGGGGGTIGIFKQAEKGPGVLQTFNFCAIKP